MTPTSARWSPGVAPVSVVMIALNEAHNMRAVLDNLVGWAQEVFLVDSFSRDETVDIALSYGVQVVQRRFRGFGDQWNFALQTLPISAPWTMKLDPDERLTDQLKHSLCESILRGNSDGFTVDRRLWWMGRPLPVRQRILRVWRTGRCRFTDVAVNEHPLIVGRVDHAAGEMEHHDSPDLEHWLDKQNRYTTAEALMAYRGDNLAAQPRLFGTSLQRRMWLKKHFRRIPFRYAALFAYNYLVQGTWRAGWPGYAWARLRTDVMRLREYKYREMIISGRMPATRPVGPGEPDPRLAQYD